MSRPRPDRERDRSGHADGCSKPMIKWVQALGYTLGYCDSCASVFTRRKDWQEADQ